MSRRIIPITTAINRHLWLEKLGGLDTVSVRNREWLILLREDTRNSLMIEGHFVSRAEIADLIENPKYTDIGCKIMGYFEAALASYELAFQQYKTNEFKITKPIIRQMHSLMFRGDPNFHYSPGEWRTGPVEIQGAQIKPVDHFNIERCIEYLVDVINTPEDNFARKLAVVHDMFEQIHPFPDGNGRVGRILMNFILVAHGLPNIAIKGTEKEKKVYISALEEADPIISKALKIRAKNPFSNPLVVLEDLINKSLATSMDIIICSRYDKIKPLMPLNKAAENLSKPLHSFRVACSQKKYICAKIDGKVKTHPDLLDAPVNN